MNGKERIFTTLSHRKTDRFALGYDATPEVTKSLIKYFRIDQRIDLSVSKIGTFRSLLGDEEYGMDHEIELLKTLGVDLAWVACPTSKKTIGNWFGLPLISRLDNGKIRGAWDIGFKEFEYPYGTYIELDDAPLANADKLSQFIEHPSPSFDLWNFDALKSILPKYRDFFVVIHLNGCFDFARFMRGSEQFFLDLVLEPKKAEILLDKVNDFAIAFLEKCMNHMDGLVDGVFCGDDFGTQRGLIMSPEMWRHYIKPRYKKLVSVVKDYGLKYFHHTCGGVRSIIPDMIEIGFDVLNPIQPLAAGMDCKELSTDFGDTLTFHGAIDEQRTLPSGKPEDVRNEVVERIRTLGKYNGYIVAPSHGFQPDTPIENILALYEAVLGYSF